MVLLACDRPLQTSGSISGVVTDEGEPLCPRDRDDRGVRCWAVATSSRTAASVSSACPGSTGCGADSRDGKLRTYGIVSSARKPGPPRSRRLDGSSRSERGGHPRGPKSTGFGGHTKSRSEAPPWHGRSPVFSSDGPWTRIVISPTNTDSTRAAGEGHVIYEGVKVRTRLRELYQTSPTHSRKSTSARWHFAGSDGGRLHVRRHPPGGNEFHGDARLEYAPAG